MVEQQERQIHEAVEAEVVEADLVVIDEAVLLLSLMLPMEAMGFLHLLQVEA
jgi:hypothetical protein